jgi:Inner membrane component of T3SS, cytoplasmic domain
MRTVFSALAAVVVVAAPAAAQQQVWTADIAAAPQRFWNREVILQGEVTEVQPNPPETARGTYLLIDDSDPGGILVRTKNLPAPGKYFRVRGRVIQNPENAAQPLLQEVSRNTPAPGWLLPLIILSGAVAVVLIVAITWTVLHGAQPGRIGARSSVAALPIPVTGPIGNSDSHPETVRVPAVRDDDKTRLFRRFGARLEVLEGPDAGKKFVIGTSPLLLGRAGARRNDVVLSDPTVSRSQARILFDEGKRAFTLVNESPTNSTAVEDEEVNESSLSDGDRISMGSSVLVFRRDG